MESPEKIYASPSEDSPSEDEGEYEDEPPPRRELTAAEKREFEEEIDALSSHSSDPEGPEDPGDPRGKSIEEITAWCIPLVFNHKMDRYLTQTQADFQPRFPAEISCDQEACIISKRRLFAS